MIRVTVTLEPFDAGTAITSLSGADVGAVASFIGIVRDDGGLVALTLEHYPAMTHAALQALAEVAASRWSLAGVVVHHRIGRLVPGDPIVLVATAAAHRHPALEACAFLIDRLKIDAPFWKHESYRDGRNHWVEPRASDASTADRWR